MKRIFRTMLMLMLTMSMCLPAGSLAFAQDDATDLSDAASESNVASAEDAAASEADSDEATVDASSADSEEAAAEEVASDDEATADGGSIMLLAAPANGDPVSPVYINGATGNDDNEGTKDAPVKSFAKARELLQAGGGDVIYVTGAITLSGSSEDWELGGKTLKRDEGYHGDLVKVLSDASLTLRDIVIDGAKEDGAYGLGTGGYGNGGSLIFAQKGVLTIAAGAILQNNVVQANGHWYPEGGGAVYANESSVSIEGGVITGNSAVYGGGIYAVNGSVVNLESGSISNNSASLAKNPSLPAAYSGTGGGVLLDGGSKMTMSGGTIENNTAFERGGGISLGTYYASLFGRSNGTTELTMTGGAITGNSAGAGGGGIFVQAGYSSRSGNPNYGIARIIEGDITNNSMTSDGYASSMFGGGGIYVNGYDTASYPDFHNGELYITNLNLSENYAAIAGAGYAACPVSVTEVSLTDGAVLYGNTTNNGNAREVYILASPSMGAHSGEPPYEVSPSMLGGGAYYWVDDNGNEIPLSSLAGVLRGYQSLSLSNGLTADDESVQTALGMAKVNITNNSSATRGGGIGSNGSVFVGRSSEPVEITVVKEWADADDKEGARPSQVMAELYRDGEYVGFQFIRDDQGVWSTTFKNLPKYDGEGHEFVYTVKERAVDGYAYAVEGDAANGFTITNTRATSVSGQKVWDDSDDHDGLRPTSVTVALLRNGLKIASSAVSAADDWAFSFEGLAKYDADGSEYEYAVIEDDVSAGYTASVEGDAESGFVITNKHVPEFVSIAVSKVWEGATGVSATIRLLADGIDTGKSIVLDAANGWVGAFVDLPKVVGGQEVSYSVAEDEVEGYTAKVSGDAENGFTVTNTENEEPTPDDPDNPEDPKGDEEDNPSNPASRDNSVVAQTGDDSAVIAIIALGAVMSALAALIARRKAFK